MDSMEEKVKLLIEPAGEILIAEVMETIKNQYNSTVEVQVVDRYDTIYSLVLCKQDYNAEKFIDKFTLDFATNQPVFWRGFVFEKETVYNYFLNIYTKIPFSLKHFEPLFGDYIKLDHSELILDLSKSVPAIKKMVASYNERNFLRQQFCDLVQKT